METIKAINPSGRIVRLRADSVYFHLAKHGERGWSEVPEVSEPSSKGEASASPEPVAPRRKRGRPRKHVEEAAE